MTAVWWFPLASIILNLCSAVVFALNGNVTGFFYWCFCAGLTLCVMVGLTR